MPGGTGGRGSPSASEDQSAENGWRGIAVLEGHLEGSPRVPARDSAASALDDYPNDDAANVMELRGEYFDATPVDSLARRVNHRAPGNMQFVEDETSPYALLQNTVPVRAGQQLFVD